MRALLWSYLGWRRFPRELSAFEVAAVLLIGTCRPPDLAPTIPHARPAWRRDSARVRSHDRDDARCTRPRTPRRACARGQQLSLPAPELTTLRALYRGRKTLFEHQAWACSYAGLRWPEPDDVAAVTELLASDSAATLDRHRLATAAREALIARGCLIQGGRDVDDWVRRAVQWVELEDRKRLDATVPAYVHDRWLPGLLSEVGAGCMLLHGKREDPEMARQHHSAIRSAGMP